MLKDKAILPWAWPMFHTDLVESERKAEQAEQTEIRRQVAEKKILREAARLQAMLESMAQMEQGGGAVDSNGETEQGEVAVEGKGETEQAVEIQS